MASSLLLTASCGSDCSSKYSSTFSSRARFWGAFQGNYGVFETIMRQTRRGASKAGKRQMACTQMKPPQCLRVNNNRDEGEEENKSSIIGPRRRGLIHAASMISLSLLGTPSKENFAFGAPIVPPDLNTCGPATVTTPPGVPIAPTTTVNCCMLPPPQTIIDYQLPSKPNLHKRKPAHKVNSEYIAKYNKAYEIMKALPSTDPRNFMRQADIHCAFCNGAYNQLGSNNKLQVHFSWLFLPWHRWFLYFHERILGKLIDDPDFALVYWNWDNQANVGGNIMPTMFTQQGSALYDAKRNQNHLPPVLNTLALTDLATSNALTNKQIIQDNLNVMYQSIVTASTPDLFMGKKYSAGDPEPNIGGTLENAPHTAIHAWTGSDKETYLEDMGNFYSAARDPIFFAHHANVDRLWAVWNTLGGRRQDHTDPDFLDAKFVFYDEDGHMVRVTVEDVLDNSKLGVTYARVNGDQLWFNYEPKPLSTTPSTKKLAYQRMGGIKELGPALENTSQTKIDKKLVSLVKRPTTIPQYLLDKGLDAEDLEEVLCLEYVEVPRNVATHIAVFINLPEADANTPLSIAEYAGSFINVPHFVGADMDMSMRSAYVRFGISDNLRRLGLTDQSTISVTIVVKLGGTEEIPISLKGIKIEYE